MSFLLGGRMRGSKKKCKSCRRVFTPDPRVGDRQVCCQLEDCKKHCKRVSQKRWCRANRDYFQGRYEETRLWRERNPGYQKRWRRGRSEIQDEMAQEKSVESMRLMLPVCILKDEIQDEIRLKYKNHQDVRALFVREIQDEIYFTRSNA